MNVMNLECFDDIKSRGLIHQSTILDIDELQKILNGEKLTFYVGFDPTADSLHIGHLLPIFLGARLIQFGHRMIVLIGGATGRIGDPSERNKERVELSIEFVNSNANNIQNQIFHIIKSIFLNISDNEVNGIEEDSFFIDTINGTLISDKLTWNLKFVNNKNWLDNKNYLNFLKDIGRHININKILSMKSIKNRLDNGLSFLEFNYVLMQAYDFLFLNEKYGCTMQIGGQDQWCNIVAGIDLIRRKKFSDNFEIDDNFTSIFGFTLPLLLDVTGQKFGKTSDTKDSNFWLKSFLYENQKDRRDYLIDYFNFWRNIDDSRIIQMLMMFTFLPLDEINEFRKKNADSNSIYINNRLKEILAYEAVKIGFGRKDADMVFAFINDERDNFDPENLLETSSYIKNIKVNDNDLIIKMDVQLSRDLLDFEFRLSHFIYDKKLCVSVSDAKRLIASGAVDINDEIITDVFYKFKFKDHISKKIDNYYAIKLRIGKKIFSYGIKI